MRPINAPEPRPVGRARPPSASGDERREKAGYVRAYLQQPQTDEEFGYSDIVSIASLTEVPWEE